MDTPAPFHAHLAGGPARAQWVHASDGARLRAVAWEREGARGTVLLLVGRTEYAEKYGVVARDLGARGLACATVDWRGQGLSDRLRADRLLGHVARFADYRLDVAALCAHADGLGMPRPWFLLSHSMGGAVGLRCLHGGLRVAAAAFVAPMWGIRMRPHQRPLAWTVSSLARGVGLGHLVAPGQEPGPYVLRAGFPENTLTRDEATFLRLRAQLEAEPDLALGGPSLLWLNEALREMCRLRRLPAPDVPTLALMGGDEAVVDAGRVRARMAAWPGGRLLEFPGAHHELLMEVPAVRERALDAIADHFLSSSAR